MTIAATKPSLRATATGLVAVLLWASVVGMIKSVSSSFGATGGAALIYSLASVFLFLSLGLGDLRTFPRRYLVVGGLLFVSYELCLALSIGYTTTPRQAIEVGMVNYLWPTLTLVGTVVFNRRPVRIWIVPGLLLSMIGIVWVLGGDAGFSLPAMLDNVRLNPLSYGLALAGALIWAAYCVVTPKLANGRNGATLFFAFTAMALWAKLAFTGDISWNVGLVDIVMLVLASAAMGFAYAAWNVGILHGNATALATASYFTPVLSAAFAAALLQSALPLSFWQGAAMVSAGSVVCWLATRK
ncbi:aromatic amino acid DMT transporter YddG [Devosia sediminis]|uniref:Aromatic amino acid DMT transporter YddG n=1 Tax=Devosia sediminis TaxID=2798801 RepID=A0A934J2Q8_9HYPH|nr:aromatic amino acid DMT transporter YddG [Devosia sediminis]MBJ3786777.1 aromatic amino acid DMT transporter YddG [Devosia sediminis]